MSRSAAWAILARLEALRFVAFWRRAVRDLVFDFAVLAGLAVVWATLARLYRSMAGLPLLTQVLTALGCGAALAWQIHGGPASKARQTLASGPFHMLVCAPGDLERWMRVRTAAICGLVLLPMCAVLARFNVLFAAGALLFALAGVAASLAVEAVRPRGARAQPRAAAPRPAAPRLRSRWPAELLVSLAAQRRGAFTGWGVSVAAAVIGGLAAGLAARNNASPHLGQAMAAVCGFLAGVVWLPGGRLPGVLGQQPLSFGRLYLWLYAAPVAVATVGGGVAALIAGQGLIGAAEVASISGTALFVLAWIHFTHRMIRSERNTPLSTTLEFANALMLSAVDISLAPFYILVRGVILVRAARRRRWLDR